MRVTPVVGRVQAVFAAAVVLAGMVGSQARTITVGNEPPADFNNIQAAISDANNGDTILIQPGTYMGSGNCDIDFLGKAITIRSTSPDDPNVVAATVIDCSGLGRGFTVVSIQDSEARLDGLTVRNGYAIDGGAVYCQDCNVVINNCSFTENTAEEYGGAVYFEDATVTLYNCMMTANDVEKRSLLYIDEYGHFIYISYGGGGGYSLNSDVTIMDCVVAENSVPGAVGGLWCVNGQIELSGTHVYGNTAGGGGGCSSSDANGQIVNCIIEGNTTSGEGGGVVILGGSVNIQNCTVIGNKAFDGGGLMVVCEHVGEVAVSNCIFWNNFAFQNAELKWLNYEDSNDVSIRDSCIEGGAMSVRTNMGMGLISLDLTPENIDTDPCFASPGRWAHAVDPNISADPCDSDSMWIPGDYHLKSQAGRWEPMMRAWVTDDVTSGCIDTGDPAASWQQELWPHGKRVNMGCYGNTAQASMSLNNEGRIADLDGDGVIYVHDLHTLANQWLVEHDILRGDMDRNGIIDFDDVATFAQSWYDLSLPGQASNPVPADASSIARTSNRLTWAMVENAAWYDVYFGTSPEPPYAGRTGPAFFDVNTLEPDMQYFWRVDAGNRVGTTPGVTWDFQAMSLPGQATNPSPAHGAEGIDTSTVVLTWNPGADAVSHDVYFGTTNPPQFRSNRDGTSFEVGGDTGLLSDTTYYWRIDEIGEYGTTTGVVWSFFTGDPNPR